jgi:two-component system response regulator HydG
MRGRILIVDDEPAMVQMVETGLSKRDFVTRSCTSAAEALACLRAEDCDVLVTDLNMKGGSGLDLCVQVHALMPDVAVVVITAFGSLEAAVQAIRAGAHDFLTKPFDIEQLALTLDRAVTFRALRAEVRRLQQQIDRSHLPDLVGDSVLMRELFDLVARVGPTDATVLIAGETGTGKELVARALHERSARAKAPFVAVNCAAIPEALLESELFGHVRGAFTDARAERTGLFQKANGGTLFLDEIGDLHTSMQPKLLRVLQERTVRPVGSDAEVAIDVRIIAASHRDLATALETGAFREDLYYRLDVVHLDVPPLRARGGDVLLLAQHFVVASAAGMRKQVAGITAAAAQKLLAYPWPGNVRELQNAIERAVALTSYEQLTVEDLPPKVKGYESAHVLVASDDPSELVTLEEVERRYILRTMQAVGGNRTHAARILGLDRKTLYRKLQQYEKP